MTTEPRHAMSRTGEQDLLDGDRASAVAFESDRSVLVAAVAGPRRHHLLRCGVSEGACERALSPGRPTWVFAERAQFWARGTSTGSMSGWARCPAGLDVGDWLSE